MPRLIVLVAMWLGAAGALPGVPAQEPAPAEDPLARAGRMLERGEAQTALALLEATAAARHADRPEAPLAPVLRLQGYALVVLRREAEAEQVFRALLRLAPGDEYGNLELAKRLHARAAFDEARARYRTLLRIRPDHPTAGNDLERLEADARAHAGVADRIARGRGRVWILAGATLVVLTLFGWLLARFLRRPEPAGS